MNLVKIVFEPQAVIRFNRPEVEFLMECSQHHYDGACRDISEPGGFLHGINNLVDTREYEARLRFRHVSMLAKVLECTHGNARQAARMSKVLRHAMDDMKAMSLLESPCRPGTV